jgi:aspartate oxidase
MGRDQSNPENGDLSSSFKVTALDRRCYILSIVVLIEDNADLMDALEMQGMLDSRRIMVKAALLRKESRGSHYREDFSEKNDENLLKSIITKRVEG